MKYRKERMMFRYKEVKGIALLTFLLGVPSFSHATLDTSNCTGFADSVEVSSDSKPVWNIFTGSINFITTLVITGTNQSEKYEVTLNNGNTLIVRTNLVNDTQSCDRFENDTFDRIEVFLKNGNDIYDGSTINKKQIIRGGSGRDRITTGSKQDTIYGEGGTDILTGNDYIDGGSNSDTIYGGKGNDILNGRYGNDNIDGSSGSDTISGGPGNDLISGGYDDDTIYGNDGNDYIAGDCELETPGGHVVYDGFDCTQYGSDRADIIYGGDGDDVITGNGGADKIYGEDGDDYLTGNGQTGDRVYGGDDDDLILQHGDDNPNKTSWFRAWGNGGDDLLLTMEERSDISGGGDNDAVISTATNMEAKLYGGDAGDYLWSGDSAPVGSCGSGDDKGMATLNSCEGITYYSDWEGLLHKLQKRSNFDNPFYEAALAHATNLGGFRAVNAHPRAALFYNLLNEMNFYRWRQNRNRSLADFNYWEVFDSSSSSGSGTVDVTTGYCYSKAYGTTWKCYEKIVIGWSVDAECIAYDGSDATCAEVGLDKEERTSE